MSDSREDVMYVLKGGKREEKKSSRCFSAPSAWFEGEVWLVCTGRPCQHWRDVATKEKEKSMARQRDTVLDYLHVLLIIMDIFALWKDVEKPSA